MGKILHEKRTESEDQECAIHVQESAKKFRKAGAEWTKVNWDHRWCQKYCTGHII